MGSFNIDFNQFAPSSKQTTVKPKKPVISTSPQITAPKMSPSPAPIAPVQNTPAPQVQPQVVDGQMNPHGSFLSGNLLSKAFDLIRAPEYGITGFLKNMKAEKNRQDQVAGRAPETQIQELMRTGLKGAPLSDSLARLKAGFSGVIPGIQNRNQFGSENGDVNLGKEVGVNNKYGQFGINLGASLMSPTLPIGKVAGAVAKVPGIKQALGVGSNLLSKASNFAKETPLLYNAIEKVNPYFRNPEVGKMVEGASAVTQSRLTKMLDTLKSLNEGLSSAEQKRVGQLIEGGVTENGKLGQIAERAKTLTTQIGKEAVDANLLSPESFDKFKGQYLTHIWENADQPSQFMGRVKDFAKVGGKFFQKRTGADGYIQQFAPAMFKGLGNEVKDIETVNLFKQLATRFGQKIEGDVPQGMADASKLIDNPKTASYFKGLALPSEVVDYINKVRNVTPTTTYDKALNIWKAGKTIYNPAYHVRNQLSNQILSDMSTGEGLAKTTLGYIKSALNLSGRGEQKFVDAAKEGGLVKNASMGSGFSELLDNAGLKSKSLLSKITDIPKNFQGASEESAKLNVFSTWIKKFADKAGKTVDEALTDPELIKKAADKAQEAIFSPYKISPTERSAVSRLVPFYSFTRQALPFTVKTFLNNPDRVAKYPRLKNAIESLSSGSGITDKNTPDQYKSQIRTPFKNKNGQYTYVDPTYVYPFGNMFDPGGEQGKLPFGFGIRPDLQEVMSQASNYDPFLQKKIADSNIPSENIKKRLSHVAYTAAPTTVNNVSGKIIPALQGTQDAAGRDRSVIQAITDTLFGIKQSRASKKDLETKQSKTDVAKLRSIQQEEQNIQSRGDLSPQEKRDLIFKLRSVYENSFK